MTNVQWKIQNLTLYTKKDSNKKLDTLKNTLTFDDILLVPQYSDVLPSSATTKVHFAKDISLNIPIISSAMDTVTDHKIAIVMAQNGGFGVIHRNLNVIEQAQEVSKVKKYESGMIQDPLTLPPDAPVSEALDLMKEYKISGVPITINRKLVGILTNRDLRFETNINQPISNVMTKENLVTAKLGTTLFEAEAELRKYRIEKLPVVDNKGELKGLITVKDIEKARKYPNSSKDSHGRLLSAAAVGTDAESYDRVDELISIHNDILVIDTAHGHSKNVIKMIKYIKGKSKSVIIVAGNVVTSEATETLIKNGADVIKVGVGPGSVCTTRIVAGVGIPQVSAVYECAKVANKHQVSVVADGGIKYSGDITKALALGANTVMIGSLLAGTDEALGETVLYQGRTYKVYRGMGSVGAMEVGGGNRYNQESNNSKDLIPEGIESQVPYRGSASGVIHQLVGGLKSGMGYLGASTIEELQQKAQFVKISPPGLKESHVHDVMITKEAPNYRLRT